MVSQSQLGDMFFRGETSGKASNVEIQDAVDTTRLVGYGHAAYAIRFKETGKTVEFGWRGYSVTTSCQLTKLGTARCDEHIDARPTVKPWSSDRQYVGEFEDDRELAQL